LLVELLEDGVLVVDTLVVEAIVVNSKLRGIMAGQGNK
jgi:hypothetical protein